MYEWGAEQMNAFCSLKERLISAPILGMPTDSGMFLLDSDASSVGLGAVISQMQNGKEVVIAYAPRSLSNAERNYDTTKRELLAVTFGLRTFRQYLLGRKFTIRTDHSALQWLRKTPEPMAQMAMAQMARWLAYIEQFDFEIQHRAGTKHGNADGLSRTPTHEDAVRTVKQQNGDSSVDDIINDREVLTKAQLEDPDIGPVLRAIMRSPEVPDIGQLTPEAPDVKRFVAEWFRLKLVDQVLYRLKPAAGGRPEYLQLVVPLVCGRTLCVVRIPA